MNYMAVLSIATLSFALAAKALIEGKDVNNYFLLINEAHKFYYASCVIFVHPGDYHDLNATTVIHTWSREFSRQRVMTMAITFSDLMREYNKFKKTIVRPLFVVFLDTGETMSKFVNVTRNVKPMSFPAWFVMFLRSPGNPLEKYCKHPNDNVFNVTFNTIMLVLCYDDPILNEWYAVSDNRTRTFNLATWSPDRGLTLREHQSLYIRRNDMFGEVMRVASVEDTPFFVVKDDEVTGFFGLVLLELSRVMNFTMEFLDPVTAYGSKHNNMWTGVIGQLHAHKADIGVSEFSITLDRLEVVDFTLPLIQSKNRLYFKRPDGTSVQWSGYFNAFSSGIWIALVSIIIISSILLTIMKAKGCFSMKLIFENYINVWGIYCQQGLSEFPNESSIRLAFFSISVSSLVIMSVYSASLISYITLTKASLPFSTLEGYVEDGSYKLIVMVNSAEYDVPRYTKDPLFLRMYELLDKKDNLPSTLADGFTQLCEKKKLAFYTTEIFKGAMDVYLPCKLVHIDSGKIDNLAMALTKRNPYTEFINYHLRRLQFSGVMSKLQNRYLLKSNPPHPNYDVVSLGAIASSLAIMSGGIVLALFILIIERMYYYFNTYSTFMNSEFNIKKSRRNLCAKVRKKNKKNQKKKNQFRGIYDKNYARPIGYWP